ncbi:MAG: nicotinamide-nucleotide adenylyltransferase [Candidatus Anstonellales archaeon]
MIGLFIGRFQPFHKGHLHCLRYISKKCSKIIIMIGSSNISNTFENPLTLKERIVLIKKVIQQEKNLSEVYITQVPDVHDNELWVDLVLEEVKNSQLKKFDILFTSNTLVKELFEKKGFKVKRIPFYKRESLQGMIIRKEAVLIDNKWRNSVPKYLLPILFQMKFEERLLDLAKTNEKEKVN